MSPAKYELGLGCHADRGAIGFGVCLLLFLVGASATGSDDESNDPGIP